MIKLKHKPSGRYLTISEPHAISLLKGGKEYVEVPIEEGRPELKEACDACDGDGVVNDEPAPAPVSKKKTSKKK